MKIKYAIVYSYDRTGNLKYDGTAAVLIRAYLKGRNKFFNTGIYLKPDQWDKKNQRIVKHLNGAELNKNIQVELGKIESYELQVTSREGRISLERLGDYSKDTFDITFTSFYNLQLKQGNLSRVSFTDQRQTFQKLVEFRPVIYFSELSYKFIQGFENFLYSKNLGVNTIAKHHKNLKKYINLAIQFDYLDVNSNPYKRFKVKKNPTERVYLSEFELGEFERIKIPKNRESLQQIKDFFLFCCYTGLRYSDALKVSAKNLTVTNNGIELYFKAQKTKKALRLNLSKLFGGKPNELIQRYLDQYDDFYYDDPE